MPWIRTVSRVCRWKWVFSPNLTQDHLDYHQTMDAYFEAKARLFWDGGHRCAKGLVNVDDPYGMKLGWTSGLARVRSGRRRGAARHRDGFRPVGHAPGHEPRRTVLGVAHRPGRPHNAYNLLACQGAGLLGLEPDQMQVLADAPGAPGRVGAGSQQTGVDIFVDYAHTPDALEKVRLGPSRPWGLPA